MNTIRTFLTFLAVIAAVFLTGFTPSARAAEIQILGNNFEIPDGDSTPRTEDLTFMGVQTVGAGSISKTFTVKNLSTTAGDNLNLTGTPRVVIGGGNSADFAVTTQPAAAVGPAGSTTFVVTWTPTFGGIHDATLSIANSDSDENPYNFAIQATAILTLNYFAGPNGSLTGDEVQGGFEARTAVTAVPNFGYRFVNWSDGSTANPRTDLNVTQNVNVTANFAISTAEIQILGNNVEIPDGDSTPRTEDLTFMGVQTVGAGSISKTFTVRNLSGTANDNLSLSGTPRVVIGGTNAGDFVVTTQPAASVGPAGSTTFVVTWTPAAGGIRDATLSIANTDSDENPYNFAIQATAILTLNYFAGPNGSLSGDAVQGGFEARTAVTAVPNIGYSFVNWSDGSTANPRTDLNVTQNVSVTANFAINTYTLTYTAGANGNVTGTTTQTVNYNTSGSAVTAVPATGYSFVNWSDGSTANPRTDLNVTQNVNVTANFAINTYSLTYTAGANGSLTGTTPQTVNYNASGSAVTAVPAIGHSFVNWSDSSTANPRTDTNVTANRNVTANFTINTYTLTYTAGANGSLTGTTPQTVDHGANGTAVTAVPAAGYHFESWSDGSTANPRTDTNVTVTKSVTANFAIGDYTLTYTANGLGTLTGSTTQTVSHGSNGTTVTAVPSTGFQFLGWSDSSTANPRTDTNVIVDANVTAYFGLNAPTPPPPTVTLTGSATVYLAVNNAYTEMGAFSGPSAIAAGREHSLALRSDGTVAAWGWNGDGQTTIPAGLSNVVALAAGSSHSLALRSDGTVVAWGDNGSGQTTIPAGLSNVVAIAGGGSHSLALRGDGTVAAWGNNGSGQTTIPAGLSNVVAIAGGGSHNLALRSDGTVAAWGRNIDGQTTIPAGLSNVVAIAAGGSHSLALRSDGTVVAWGWNGEGQTTIPAGLSNVVAIAADGAHSLALRGDGTVVAWGYNFSGQTIIPANVYLSATLSGSVDSTTPGSYVLTYRATNFLGVSGSATRTVVVLPPLTLTYMAGANGTINGNTSQTVVYSATASGTTVTAVPEPGYHFEAWSDGSTTNPRTDIGMVANVTVTANFALGGNTLAYTAGANGSLTGATLQTVNPGSTGTTVTAVPATGYTFVSWSDGSPINPRTETNVMMNVNVTANFRGNAPGTLDEGFNPDTNSTVSSVAVQADGKVLIGGQFTTVLGVARNRIARLNADGSLDMGFDPNASGTVNSLAVQADGKVLIGGQFATLQPNGAATATTRNRIARLNADGTLDMGFDPTANSNNVNSLVVQADGKVLIGGGFTSLKPNGAASATTRNRIARLNADGSLDEGFDPNASGAVTSLVVQAGGKVLIGGSFTSLQPNGAATATARNRIARLNADGTLDEGFDPNASGTVNSVVVQADGKMLIGGSFTTLQPNGAASATTRNRIARLNADGSLDMGFDPNASSTVNSLVVQADGKVLIGGSFTTLQPNGAATATTRRFIARLNADGTLDLGFDPAANSTVNSLAVQADGKVLIGGQFTTLQPNGAATATRRNCIARLDNDAAAQTLSVPAATQALWSRGGAAPELTRVTFEVSTDGGATWGTPVAGTRLGTTANWQATGLALPAGSLLRARGVTTGGRFNGSSGLIEQVTSFSTLAYTAGANGSLSGTTPQWVVPGASGTEITAVADAGYHFVNWSDGVLTAARTDTNVTANKSVTANFLVDAPVVDFLSPTTGLTTGGTSVTLTGINFLGASSVTFGGTEATIVSVTATSITVTTPAHAVGAVNVVVTTQGGSSTEVATFTYIAQLSALESWRTAWYGPSATNTGNAADLADPYRTGVPNLLVFAFFGPAQDPATARISQMPQAVVSGGSLSYQFTEPSGVNGAVTYGAEWSATLDNDWQPVADTGIAPVHIFSVPIDGAKKFLRLKVTPIP